MHAAAAAAATATAAARQARAAGVVPLPVCCLRASCCCFAAPTFIAAAAERKEGPLGRIAGFVVPLGRKREATQWRAGASLRQLEDCWKRRTTGFAPQHKWAQIYAASGTNISKLSPAGELTSSAS